MASTIFDFVADELERRTELDKLESRGTVRLALKEAGLDARTVTLQQMQVLLDKVLPGEMNSRGVKDSPGVCRAISSALTSSGLADSRAATDSPEEIFRRLASS